jgi:hypothetical protein
VSSLDQASILVGLYPVGTHVNNPKHDDPSCVLPLAV